MTKKLVDISREEAKSIIVDVFLKTLGDRDFFSIEQFRTELGVYREQGYEFGVSEVVGILEEIARESNVSLEGMIGLAVAGATISPPFDQKELRILKLYLRQQLLIQRSG